MKIMGLREAGVQSALRAGREVGVGGAMRMGGGGRVDAVEKNRSPTRG